jgi:hypothetical protein
MKSLESVDPITGQYSQSSQPASLRDLSRKKTRVAVAFQWEKSIPWDIRRLQYRLGSMGQGRINRFRIEYPAAF